MPTVRAIILFILAMFLFEAACGQPGNPRSRQFSVYKKLDSPLFSSQDSLTVSPNPNLSEVDDHGYPPGRYLVQADCKVNSKTTLRLCEATIEDDTLVIRISEKAPSFFYQLKISIFADSFHTFYSFTYPESADPYEVYPTDQLLVLNRSGFAPGDEIRGFINFRGTGQGKPENFGEWDSKQDYVPSEYVIRGPFRAVIR